MLKYGLKLIDRCIFAILFIIGVQAPEFIQQYIQRLSGHVDESAHHLKQFQTIANMQFDGDLQRLIQHYLQNSDHAIKQTGQLAASLSERHQLLSDQLTNLQNYDYIEKLYYFTHQTNIEIAQATLKQYKMAIPLEPQALLTGFLLAFITLSLSSGIFTAFKQLKKSENLSYKTL